MGRAMLKGVSVDHSKWEHFQSRELISKILFFYPRLFYAFCSFVHYCSLIHRKRNCIDFQCWNLIKVESENAIKTKQSIIFHHIPFSFTFQFFHFWLFNIGNRNSKWVEPLCCSSKSFLNHILLFQTAIISSLSDRMSIVTDDFFPFVWFISNKICYQIHYEKKHKSIMKSKLLTNFVMWKSYMKWM